jgi:phospholipase C
MPNPEIKHIVVLMMENRSFDHMLGFLKGEIPGISWSHRHLTVGRNANAPLFDTEVSDG